MVDLSDVLATDLATDATNSTADLEVKGTERIIFPEGASGATAVKLKTINIKTDAAGTVKIENADAKGITIEAPNANVELTNVNVANSGNGTIDVKKLAKELKIVTNGAQNVSIDKLNVEQPNISLTGVVNGKTITITNAMVNADGTITIDPMTIATLWVKKAKTLNLIGVGVTTLNVSEAALAVVVGPTKDATPVDTTIININTVNKLASWEDRHTTPSSFTASNLKTGVTIDEKTGVVSSGTAANTGISDVVETGKVMNTGKVIALNEKYAAAPANDAAALTKDVVDADKTTFGALTADEKKLLDANVEGNLNKYTALSDVLDTATIEANKVEKSITTLKGSDTANPTMQKLVDEVQKLIDAQATLKGKVTASAAGLTTELAAGKVTVTLTAVDGNYQVKADVEIKLTA